MSDAVRSVLLEYGPLGVLACLGFFLYFRERKENMAYTERSLEHQSADTAAKNLLANTLEDLADTIEVLGDSMRSDVNNCRRTCSAMIVYMREEMARESGRREVSERINIGDIDG